jgi:hypothetical protein
MGSNCLGEVDNQATSCGQERQSVNDQVPVHGEKRNISASYLSRKRESVSTTRGLEIKPPTAKVFNDESCIFAAAPKLPVFILEVFNLWLKCG